MQYKSQPKISVVIPNYNRASDLRRCLDSLVVQTFVDFEVLVCDDGSTDNSFEVATAYANRLQLRFETAPNFGGPARPRNCGIALARAPFIAFLDSDDWWTSDKLRRSYDALICGADVVYHDLFIAHAADQQSFPKRIKSTPPRIPMFHSLLCTGMSIPNSSVVARKALLEKIGGVCEDPELISVEDYDTWVGLARVTERFVKLTGCYGYYWVGGGNISAASVKQQSRIRSLYARHLADLPTDIRRRAEGFLAYRVARIAQQHGDFETALNCFREALSHRLEPVYFFKAICFAVLAAYFKLRHPCA